MSSSMWYIMQSIQSKYSLSERLIRTIAAIRSFPHDNVEDLIRGVSGQLLTEQASGMVGLGWGGPLLIPVGFQLATLG